MRQFMGILWPIVIRYSLKSSTSFLDSYVKSLKCLNPFLSAFMCVSMFFFQRFCGLIHVSLMGSATLKAGFCLRKKFKEITNMGPSCNLQALLNVNL